MIVITGIIHFYDYAAKPDMQYFISIIWRQVLNYFLGN